MKKSRILIGFLFFVSFLGVAFVGSVDAQSCYRPSGCSGAYHCEWADVTGAFWGGSGTGCPSSSTCYKIQHYYRCCDVYPNGWCSKAYQGNGNPYAQCNSVSSSQCGGGSGGCSDCTPPACPAGTAESPNTGYSTRTSCSRGSGCSPSTNTRTCYYQRQNLCTSASTSKVYLKSGETAAITAVANTNVNTFTYAFYNTDNGNAVVCSATQIAGWATTQGECAAGRYQLIRSNYYATARSSETTTFPDANIFINDANWGGQQVKNLQINTYFRIDNRPTSLPIAACVFNQRLCSPLCSPTACAPTYSTSSQGYGSTSFSCNNSPAACGSETRTCYCYACTPAACVPTYSTTNYGYGSVTLSCTNNCSVQTNRTCYVDRCSNCTLPSCPSPLTDTATTSNPNMILQNFRSCTRGAPCGGPSNFGSCYEQVSPQPTATLQVHPDEANVYGFSSTTHTGNRQPSYNLNDPIRMTATYTDVNGHTDIEAVSVWFREFATDSEVASPLWIDTATNPSQPPKAPSSNSWGFMMRWEGSAWRPYVPSYPAGGTAKWVRAVYSGNSFVISGPGGLQMIRVTIGHNLQSNITRSGNNVVLPFQLSFNFESGYENVAQSTYQIYLMGNDVFSFTPSDNYSFSVSSHWAPGQLRYRTSPAPAQLYARQWSPSGYSWTIDKEIPNVENLSMTVIGETSLRLDWRVADSKEIYAIVGNIYASVSMPPDPPALSISGSNMDINSPFNLITDFSDLAKLNTGYAFRKLSIGGKSYENSAVIDIGSNKEGSLVIYLSVFDMAGNMQTRSMTYSLGDWIVTDGGLAYSSDGKSYEVKTIDIDNAWAGASALAGMNSRRADVSSELFGDTSAAGTMPSGLDKSSLTNSYHMRPFTMNRNITSLYGELKKAYNDREIEGKADLTNDLPAITQLNGSLKGTGSCLDGTSVCILKYTGNLEVGNQSRFVCNAWGVFLVDGNLTIHNGIENTNGNRDACIFVVSGDVVIKEGIKESSASQLQYDKVNAYIIADGSVTIDPELGSSPKYDGVFIGGGIHSLGGLDMRRSLKLVDRNTYPALLIKYHSKYSVLSNLVFGSQVDILKTELGFKPY